jgi:16S rRNA (cytosine1402-N4)-methyltransferase
MAPAHVPVLLHEVVALLAPPEGGVVVDCTAGAGGHARALAEGLGPDGTLVAIDRDPVAADLAAGLAGELPCAVRVVRADFADALPRLADEGVRADALLMDLGLSSMQVDTVERGFSYSREAPLDMRMDPDLPASAADLVAETDEATLAAWFREYGEERYARSIARSIVRRRARAPITTSRELVEVVRASVPARALFAGGHPAKRIFQALRIAVNDELGSLSRGLEAAFSLLEVGGRMAVISFHSLEDRMVKRFMAEASRGCVCPPELPVCVCGREPGAALLTSGPLRPGAREADDNPRARSARLRACERLL